MVTNSCLGCMMRCAHALVWRDNFLQLRHKQNVRSPGVFFEVNRSSLNHSFWFASDNKCQIRILCEEYQSQSTRVHCLLAPDEWMTGSCLDWRSRKYRRNGGRKMMGRYPHDKVYLTLTLHLTLRTLRQHLVRVCPALIVLRRPDPKVTACLHLRCFDCAPPPWP